MGCDIHISIEVRREGKWFDANLYDKKGEHLCIGERSYYSFAALCGVRSTLRGCNQISEEPRGLPKDMGHWTEVLYEEDYLGEHSFSWTTLEEIRKYVDNDENLVLAGWEPFNPLFGLREKIEWALELQSIWPDFSDVRIVYGFDS